MRRRKPTKKKKISSKQPIQTDIDDKEANKNIEEEESDDSHTKIDIERLRENEVYSLDSLLETREEENKQNDMLDDYDNEKEEKFPVLLMQEKYKPLLVRDGSVFEFGDSSFPMKLLSFLEINEETYNLHFTPQLTKLQWNLIKYQPDLVMPSQTLLFSLVQQLIVTGNTEIGEYILDYSLKFPFESIEFKIWIDYLKEAIISAQAISCYIIAIARPRIFISVDHSVDKSRNLQLILIFIASLLTPQTSTPNAFNRVVKNLRDLLRSVILDADDYSFIITKSLEMSHDQPFSNVSFLVSLFPLDLNGAAILGPFAANYALALLKSEAEGIEGLCTTIHLLKNLCNSADSDDLVVASAVLALTERSITCALKFKLIDESHLNMLLDGLQFNFVNILGQEAFMIKIREQLHMTRAQIELYRELF